MYHYNVKAYRVEIGGNEPTRALRTDVGNWTIINKNLHNFYLYDATGGKFKAIFFHHGPLSVNWRIMI